MIKVLLLGVAASLAIGCGTHHESVAAPPTMLAVDPRVEATIADMTARYDALLATCDHKGLFAIAYLRTTDAYRDAATQPGFFNDPAYLNDEDTLFAKYYFDHIDAWTSGNKAQVPAAWTLSFQASDDKTVDTLGDALLGISAHINQDLPYVIASLGVTDAAGNTRKPDHDKVNAFLANVSFDADIQAHWDATYTADYAAGLPTIEAWREAAWQSALAILAATTPAARQTVDQDISDNAEASGKLILAAAQYTGTDSSAARDAYCAAHH
jgi:hypothetical protein